MNDTKPKWSLRGLRDGDEEGILDLWKVVYPERDYDRERWLRWWRWMYKENPAGPGWIQIAEHDGRIIGQSAIIPATMKVGAEVIAVFQSIDTMTHPGYRRQGIYETLAKTVYAEAAKDNVRVGYRFPNKFSHPIAIKKLDWYDVAAMQTVSKPLHWGNALKMRISNRFLLVLGAAVGNLAGNIFYRSKKTPAVEGLSIAEVPSFDERINDFWAKVANQYPIMIVRNKDYLNWRFVAVPDIRYAIFIAENRGEICGYLVLRCLQRQQTKVGIIFDIMAQSEKIAQCLIAKAVELCEREKVDLVYSSKMVGKSLAKAFRNNGFMSPPFMPGTPFCIYSNSSTISSELLRNPKNWFVQIGDSDVL